MLPIPDRILASAVGQLLAVHAGARIATLPFGLDPREAVAVVTAANAERSEIKPAYALLLMEGDELQGYEKATCVTAHEATQYREGDRLLVAAGPHLGLASLQTFLEVVGASWPEQEGEVASLDRLSRVALLLCVPTDSASEAEFDGACRLLHSCLVVLRGAYLAVGSSTENWNSLWWQHVSEGLSALASSARLASPEEPVGEFLTRRIPAAMGLPRPPEGGFRDVTHGHLAAAWKEYWGDAEVAAASARAVSSVRQSSGGRVHPISEVDFAPMTRVLARTGNSIAAWGLGLLEGVTNLPALEALTYEEFVRPYGVGDFRLSVYADGISCSQPEISGDVAVVRTFIEVDEVVSEFVDVRLPLTAESSAPLAQSSLQLRASVRSVRFDGAIEYVEGHPFARGRFVSKSLSFKPRVVKVSVEIPSGDPLDGFVPTSATASVLLLHPESTTVSARSFAGSGPTGRSEVMCVNETDGDLTVDLPGKGGHVVIVCEPSGRLVPLVQGVEASTWPGREAIRYRRTTPADILVEVGSTSLDLRLPSPPEERRLSPLVAHIDGVPIFEGPNPEAAEADVRGFLEDNLVGLIGSEEQSWRQGLGHCCLPGDTGVDAQALTFGPSTGIQTVSSWTEGNTWGNLQLPVVPHHVSNSEAADAFRRAFQDLGVRELISGSREHNRSWPSRMDLADLWGSQRLKSYLESYEGLLAHARESGSDGGILWASYPFSATVWSVQGIAQLQAVLLSPLHPLRLGWLAGVSRGVLDEGDLKARRKFSGLIEGWNLPLIGSAEVAEGSMMAIPIDNGVEQVFVGWSMLVRTPNALAPLRAPESIAGRRAPGSSVSGLNGGSAGKAMSDYRSLHPFASTLYR